MLFFFAKFTGTVVNSLAIIVGSLLGLVVRGGFLKTYNTIVLHAISLSLILIGLRGALKSEDLLLIIFSLAIGSIIGEFLGIEDRLRQLGKWIEQKFSTSSDDISKGFVNASLIFCVGAMAIVGSLESGLAGNHQTLFAKATLDGVYSLIFTSTMGIGVAFSSVSVFLYQGAITLLASLLESFLTPEVINQMSAVGGLLIMAIGFTLLEMKKLKIGNMLPAIFIPLVYFMIKQALG